MPKATLIHGDSIEWLREQEKFSLFIVTDPPIGMFVRELHDAAHTYVMCGGERVIKSGKRVIPGQKNPAAYSRIIAQFPKEMTVVDPFMGTGTIGMAALLLGRDFIGIEEVEFLFALSQSRLKEWLE